MKSIGYALPLLALAGCGQEETQQPSSNRSDAAVTAPITQTPASAPPAEKAEPAPAPQSPARLRFAGLWAVDAASCKSPPWKFSEHDLTTKGEVYCSFKRVDPVAKGYDVSAVCSAEGDELSETMRLRFDDAGKIMTVSSDQTYKPIDLIRCGD
jgi:hypothetical protein